MPQLQLTPTPTTTRPTPIRRLRVERGHPGGGFEVVGPEDAPVVVALGGISATRHVTATAADPARSDQDHTAERALVLGGGGSTGNAWSIGVISGLFDAGVDVTGADISAAAAATPTAAAGAAGAAGFAGGSRDPKAIIKAAGCTNCHMLDGQGGALAPALTHVGSRRDAASIRQKIVDPGSSTTKGYENLAGVMPKNFATMMSPAQLDALVQYLAGHK